MSEMFDRTERLLGVTAMEKLKKAHIAVFGVGGVGGYVVEGLVRSGVGEITVFDKDVVSESNINRQIIATINTVGKSKVELIKERALSINPDIKFNIHECFYLPDNADEYDFSGLTYIVDAVDTVTAKLEIITRANKMGIPVISSMGTGNKLDPTGFEVADIKNTSVCPLARVMRRELKKRGIDSLKVVYSREEAIKTDGDAPASVAFVPPVAGLIISGEVIKDIIKLP